MSKDNFAFKGNILVTGNIFCDTGLHIGESNDSLEIGGIDNMVIRDKESDLPYIPGSSLKGKLRSLLELYFEESTKEIIKEEGKVCKCGTCIPCQIFGFSNKDDVDFQGPTRIIVRDAFPDDETIEFWDKSNDLSRGTELKVENTINRIKGTAEHPRPTERVPKGSIFIFNMVFSIYYEKDKENFKYIFKGLELLEDNYLGGSGSRGYGKIYFNNIDIIERPKAFYTGENINENSLIKNFENDCENYMDKFNIRINPDYDEENEN